MSEPQAWQTTWAHVWSSPPPKPSSSEESIQAVIERLISGKNWAGYDHEFEPTELGGEFVRDLVSHAFDVTVACPPDVVVSERTHPLPLDLVTERTKGCSPDWFATWPDRVVIIELKTVAGSMTSRQIDVQLRTFRHHFPDTELWHLYITPEMATFTPTLGDRMRYRNVVWSAVGDSLLRTYTDDAESARIARFITEAEDNRWWNASGRHKP